CFFVLFFFFSSRRRHTRWPRDWSSDVCSSDLLRERVIVDSASGVMDLRDPADDRIFGKAKREAWQKITAAARSREPAHFISQMPSLIAAANRDGNGIVF